MNMLIDLPSQIHAFLFSEGGTLSIRKISKLCGTDESAVSTALVALRERLQGTGTTIVHTPTEVSLVVSPEATPTVQAAFEREMGSEIGDAGLEVLAIVLYRGPSTRAQIDYIRGVNTTTTIRTLLSRGLLERVENPQDGREYLYRATVDLLSHLGVRTTEELPDRERVIQELTNFEATSDPQPTE